MQTFLVNEVLLISNEVFKNVEIEIKTVTYFENVLDGIVNLTVHFTDKSKLDFNLPISLEDSIQFGLPSVEWVVNIPQIETIKIGIILAGSLLENDIDFDEDLFINPSNMLVEKVSAIQII